MYWPRFVLQLPAWHRPPADSLRTSKTAGYFIRKIDMPRGVNEIQNILLAVVGLIVQANGVCLDRDTPLSLQVHRVEHLRHHLTGAERSVNSRIRSARVDFPWSIWAMIEKI